MNTIPETVIRMIVHPDSSKVLTTVSKDGEPHSIVCGSLMYSDGKIVAGEVFMQRTGMNLKDCPKAEFLIWHGKHGFSLKATPSERLTEGPLFDDMVKHLDMIGLVPKAVWIFEIDEIWEESATDQAGQRIL